MSEDEAFIRSLVDAPGDDAPRLIYADWLDERGDPRGPYLRAEVDWAIPWRDGDKPEYNVPLWDLALGLDPIWVARVSRPPKGVCLDHIRIRKPGPQVTLADIEYFERRESIFMPDPLTAFLLNFNGGVFDRRFNAWFRQSQFGTIRMLSPARWKPRVDKSLPRPLTNIRRLSEPNWGQVIEFADDPAEGSYWIGVISGIRGIVYYLDDREALSNAQTVRAQTIAASLPELFANLS